MSEEDWKRLNDGLNAMKDQGKLEKYASLFADGLPPQSTAFLNFQQLPWFRHFLYDFETELQVTSKDCDLSLPYWSACSAGTTTGLDSSSIWSSNHLGGHPQCQGDEECSSPSLQGAQMCQVDEDRWCLGDGIAGHWHVSGGQAKDGCDCVHRSPGTPHAREGTCATMLPIMRMTKDFKSLVEMTDAMRATMHCGQATGEKSTLCSEATAVWDPLFWFHYSYLDRIFFGWQRYHYNMNDIDSTDCYGCDLHMSHFDEPLSDWFGKHDITDECILVPKQNPRACISYAYAKA